MSSIQFEPDAQGGQVFPNPSMCLWLVTDINSQGVFPHTNIISQYSKINIIKHFEEVCLLSLWLKIRGSP